MENKERGFIVNILAIIVVLGIVFFSQQARYSNIGGGLNGQISQLSTNAINWFKSNIFPRISGEVTSRGEQVKQEIDKQKDMVAQSLWNKIKIIFQEKFNEIFKTNVK